MKKYLVLFAVLVPCFCCVKAQNAGQLIASQYGEFKVYGSSSGGFSFPPATCQVSAGGKNFAAFSTGIPIKVVDSNPSLTEVATPSSVYISVCSVNMATMNTHVPPYYLTSGTGGLQEAITANQTTNGPNTIVLDAEWYRLIAPASATSVIATVHGIPDLGLTDITTTPYTSYQWNGSQYTVVAASGNYNQGSPGAVTQTITAKLQQSISVKDFGAVGDGAHMAADTAGLKGAVGAAAISGQAVYIPAGNYLLDNSSAAVLSGAQNVRIFGDGPSSSLACQTIGASDCIASTGATGFGLSNLAISFGPAATARTSGYALDVQSCTNCSFDGVTLNNGDLSGFRLASSLHTSMHNMNIANFEANGLFAINNQDLRVNGLSCANNADACFETSWYDSQYTVYSIPCQDITAEGITSIDDTETLLINSCNNVTVNGFVSLGSGREAVFVGEDNTTTTAQWPDRISISNGTIYGAGYGTNSRNSPTAQALYINVADAPGPGVISHIALSNIVATHISGWGLQMAELQNDDLQLSNLRFYDIGAGNTAGCLQLEGNEINYDNISCTLSGTYAMQIVNTKRLTGTNFTSTSPNQVGSGFQALYNTSTGFINLNGMSFVDTATGTYSSQIYDNTNSGGPHQFVNILNSGTVTPTGPTAASASTTVFEYADPVHAEVHRNGGTIFSYAPPNVYLVSTNGATSTSYVPSPQFYFQSKCWASGAQQTESVAWVDLYPTLSTESVALTKLGGCGFPITMDFTAANSMLVPLINDTGTVSAVHFSGYANGTYASVPTLSAGPGAGTSPTISLNANSNDLSGYLSVTTGASPAASATIATGTFGTAYATLAKCSLWPANAAAELLGTAGPYIPVGSATAFSLTSTTALAASTLYTWGYTCTQ
ncbi:MAG: glycosyl hydrolase family 28-related protein [Acidobacteriaceae bacterium]